MIRISKSWLNILKSETEKSYFKDLQAKLNVEYNNYTIYPKMENIFASINYVPFDKVKVVIIGQDPYHEPNQAMGLSFAVPDGEKLPPSLQNIFKEIESDLQIKCNPSGDLRRWAVQGVLLLNTVLTVRRGVANSHKGKGWENFTKAVIEKVNEKDEPVVFILWGNNAKSFLPILNTKKHFVLSSAHPSPLSAYNGFFGCKHFSKANKFLQDNGKTPIDWK